jgi:hypothetical protein
MAKVEVYRCDECGAEKKETNHWFLISSDGASFFAEPWSDHNAEAGYSAHICGEQCAHKVLQKWLEGVK